MGNVGYISTVVKNTTYEVLRLVWYAFFSLAGFRLPRLGFIGFRAGDVLGNLTLGLRVFFGLHRGCFNLEGSWGYLLWCGWAWGGGMRLEDQVT